MSQKNLLPLLYVDEERAVRGSFQYLFEFDGHSLNCMLLRWLIEVFWQAGLNLDGAYWLRLGNTQVTADWPVSDSLADNQFSTAILSWMGLLVELL